MNLDNHILQTLQSQPTAGRAMTINELARRFGATPFVVLQAAHRLVDSGLATPAMISVHGVPTLRGLSPMQAPAAPTPS